MSNQKNKVVFLVIAIIAAIVIGYFFIANPNKTNHVDDSGKDDKELIESIKIRINDNEFKVIVDKNKAAQEFAESTPFELEMRELNGNEKYYRGEDKLDTSAEYKPGSIKAGDLMLYEDDTIVLFYKDFESQYKYTRLGWVQNADNLAEILGDDNVSVIFTKQ